MCDYTPGMKSPARSALLLATVLLGGCAADDVQSSGPDDGAEVDELDASSLRASTTFKGSVAAGSTLTVRYDRADGHYPRTVPYLAVEILAAPATAAQSAGGLHPMNGEIGQTQMVTVHGDFPGKPRVLVVDESFTQLKTAVAQVQADGTARAEFAAPRGAGRRFILVRDGRWVKPMSFQIGVGQ